MPSTAIKNQHSPKDAAMTITTLTHHFLKAEKFEDKQGPAIMLTQQEDDGYSAPNCVILHPWQLRAVCEQFGLVASDGQAAKTIATLQRRMVALRDRIDNLGRYITNCSDHEHADLSYELNSITALADLADEFCADFADAPSAPENCGSISGNATDAPAPAPTPAAQAALL